MQMQRVLELESKTSFGQFKEDLGAKIEEERLLSEAPVVPTIQPLDSFSIETQPFENVGTVMNQFYERLGASDRLKVLFREFQSQSLRFATYDLNSTLSLQSLDIEDSGQLVFDFVELEAQTD
jgi:hypothetical protein